MNGTVEGTWFFIFSLIIGFIASVILAGIATGLVKIIFRIKTDGPTNTNGEGCLIFVGVVVFMIGIVLTGILFVNIAGSLGFHREDMPRLPTRSDYE